MRNRTSLLGEDRDAGRFEVRHDHVVRRHIGARERTVIALHLHIEIARGVDFHDLPARIRAASTARFNRFCMV